MRMCVFALMCPKHAGGAIERGAGIMFGLLGGAVRKLSWLEAAQAFQGNGLILVQNWVSVENEISVIGYLWSKGSPYFLSHILRIPVLFWVTSTMPHT